MHCVFSLLVTAVWKLKINISDSLSEIKTIIAITITVAKSFLEVEKTSPFHFFLRNKAGLLYFGIL